MHPAIRTVLGWLRSGYPEGVPPKDYFPLLAVLQRKLTDDEIREVVDALIGDVTMPIEVDQIEDTIIRITREMPLDHDVRRVAVRLAAGGWPLADPESIDEDPDWVRKARQARKAHTAGEAPDVPDAPPGRSGGASASSKPDAIAAPDATDGARGASGTGGGH